MVVAIFRQLDSPKADSAGAWINMNVSYTKELVCLLQQNFFVSKNALTLF